MAKSRKSSCLSFIKNPVRPAIRKHLRLLSCNMKHERGERHAASYHVTYHPTPRTRIVFSGIVAWDEK